MIRTLILIIAVLIAAVVVGPYLEPSVRYEATR